MENVLKHSNIFVDGPRGFGTRGLPEDDRTSAQESVEPQFIIQNKNPLMPRKMGRF